MKKFLLDTHALLWWTSGDNRLPEKTRITLELPSSSVMVSVVSFWEISIKQQNGKLTFRQSIEKFIRRVVESEAVSILPISTEHIIELDTLPQLHYDPFDRMLIAQARKEEAILVSGDEQLNSYKVQIHWG